MGVYLPYTRLPSTYQEVEYIKSSGTQYINTDIKLNQTHTIELKLNINSNLNQWDKFYGGGDDGSMLFAQYEKSSGTAIQNRIKITNKAGGTMYSINPIAPGYDHTFIHSNTAFYIDGVLQSSATATTFTMNTGLNIFAMGNSQSTGREKSSYKLYYMKIYNSNNSLAYDFVPCYRKSDNVIGLYDLVNNQFYINSGSGTFSKGADVVMTELKNAYIGEVWTPTSNTVLYRPLTENANDHSGNSNNGTAYGTYTFSDTNGIAINAASTGVKFPSTFKPGANFTISCYLKNTVASQGLSILYNWTYSYRYVLYSTEAGVLRLYYGNGGTSQSEWNNIYTPGNNERHNYVFVKNGVQGTIYVDGQLIGTHTFAYNPSPQLVSGGEFSIGIHTYSTSGTARGYIKDYIIENKLWTAQEVADYYNLTKSNYGL